MPARLCPVWCEVDDPHGAHDHMRSLDPAGPLAVDLIRRDDGVDRVVLAWEDLAVCSLSPADAGELAATLQRQDVTSHVGALTVDRDERGSIALSQDGIQLAALSEDEAAGVAAALVELTEAAAR